MSAEVQLSLNEPEASGFSCVSSTTALKEYISCYLTGGLTTGMTV